MKNTVFRRLKKLVSATLAAVLICCGLSGYDISAEDAEDGSALYIETTAVPTAATDYARDMLSHLYVYDIESIGFDYSVASELRLAPGFCANIMDSSVQSDTVYYFPVMHDDEIVALFTVVYYNGEYGYQFSKDDLADALNDLSTTYENSVKIYVSPGAYYGVTDEGITVLAEVSCVKEDTASEIQLLSSSETSVADVSPTSIIEVSASTVYSETAQQTVSRTRLGIYLDSPIVNNATYYDSDDNVHGTCWASVTASLIKYYNDGSSTSTPTASTIRNAILDQRYSDTGSYTGSISVAKTFIESMVSGASMTYSSSKLSWSSLKSEMSSGQPLYSTWRASSGVGHAMAVCGYDYDSSYPSDSSYYRIRLMDPNKTSYVLYSYTDAYTIGSTNYTWSYSLTKD